MGAAVKVERLGGGELRVIVGWATPPAGYSPMATSKKGGWAKVLCPGVSVRWYPGTDPVYQARKERAAERRAAKKLAAKAAGIEVDNTMRELWSFEGSSAWNPIAYDGDALRLAAKLRLGIEFNEASVVASWVDDGYESKEIYGYPDQTQDDDFNIVYTNHDKAARRAIVRAAAEIGRQMQEGGAA